MADTPVLLASPGPGDLPDATLVARIAAGDHSAEAALYHRHAPRIHRMAAMLAGDPELGADLCQDVFVRVFARLAEWRGEAAFTTWLHRVCVTTCLNGLRTVRRRRRREQPLTLAAEQVAAGPRADPTDHLALVAAVEALPERWRGPFVLHAIEGFTHAEIAALLDLTEGSSKRLVSEARARLRASLGLDPGGTPDDA